MSVPGEDAAWGCFIPQRQVRGDWVRPSLLGKEEVVMVVVKVVVKGDPSLGRQR